MNVIILHWKVEYSARSKSHCPFCMCFLRLQSFGCLNAVKAVLRKKQNPGSPDGPPMIDGWVVRLSSGWSVNNILRPWNQLKNWPKISQSVFSLYSDTGTNRHTNGFVQDCSISSVLAMEILQSCAKPWIWYQCICRVVRPLFLRNISCKT